jgi:hypothetical protein
MLVPLVVEFKEKYGGSSLENIHIWYFFYIVGIQSWSFVSSIS